MLKTLPTISVITVCRNAAQLLTKTIESVLEQTYTEIEYIIIDGDSSDNTKEVVEKYSKGIDVFISEPDAGLYFAMNKGINNATGELLIFLNAGDRYITPYALEYTISKINIQKADIFFGRFVWEDPLSKNIVLSDNQFARYQWDLKYSNFPHPATIYKTKLFTEFGLFNSSYKILADYEWNVRALVKHRISFQYINIAVVIFRADGISNDKKNAKIIQQERDKIFDYFKPEWLFSLIERYNSNRYGNRLIEKIIARLYRKKINRIF